MQTARGRCVRGTMDVNMINNNMVIAACFAGHLPLDPFSLLYHIAVILIRCGVLVCVYVVRMAVCVCVFVKDLFQVKWMRREM